MQKWDALKIRLQEPRLQAILSITGLVLVFLVLVFRPVLLTRNDQGTQRHYPLLADAFLHGRLDIETPLYDIAIYEGKAYLPFPPLPAVLLIPQVASFGVEGTSGIALGIVLSFASAIFLLFILAKLEIAWPIRVLTEAAFLLGTGYWLALNQAQLVYYLAHLSAICFLFASLWAGFSFGQGFFSGVFLGLAFLSRQLTIFAAIFLVVLIWTHPRNRLAKEKALQISLFMIGLGVCVAAYLLYNQARFGNPLETGYSFIPLTGFLQSRVEKYGLFNLAYVPFNFIYMFLQGPNILFAEPRLLVPVGWDAFGTSLTYASPFCAAAIFARWERPKLFAAWVSIGLILGAILMYYNNGWVQWNTQRFSLDFLPLLIILVALGMQGKRSIFWPLAILYSIALNVFLVARVL